MITRLHTFFFFFISCITLSLNAMKTDGAADGSSAAVTVVRKAASHETFGDIEHMPRGNRRIKTTEHAFFRVLPDATTLRSNYVTDATTQASVVEALVNVPLVTTQIVEVKEEGATRSIHKSTQYQLDIRRLEESLVSSIIVKERTKIAEEARKDEQNKLSLLQRNPKRSFLIALAVGVSLPYVMPLALEELQKYLHL